MSYGRSHGPYAPRAENRRLSGLRGWTCQARCPASRRPGFRSSGAAAWHRAHPCGLRLPTCRERPDRPRSAQSQDCRCPRHRRPPRRSVPGSRAGPRRLPSPLPSPACPAPRAGHKGDGWGRCRRTAARIRCPWCAGSSSNRGCAGLNGGFPARRGRKTRQRPVRAGSSGPSGWPPR